MKRITLSLLLFVTTFALHGQTRELFNGRDLSGWNVFTSPTSDDVFQVKDGLIQVSGQPMGYLYTQDVFEDFQLHIEWRYPEKASNSGIFLFVQDQHQLWPNAIECQLQHGNAGEFVLLGGSDAKEYKIEKGKQRPKFPIMKKISSSAENPIGEWNCADIQCTKGKITVFINGILQNTATSKHSKGHIALQSEGGPIQFRHVRITTKEAQRN